MENASKALIIAGAIILGILIIGLGMAVFNQAKEAITGSNMDAEKLAAINSKFESYLGTKVKGSTVRSLIDVVKNNNLTADGTTTYTVNISYKASASANATTVSGNNATGFNNLKNTIIASATYKVEATYGGAGGAINSITITKN